MHLRKGRKVGLKEEQGRKWAKETHLIVRNRRVKVASLTRLDQLLPLLPDLLNVRQDLAADPSPQVGLVFVDLLERGTEDGRSVLLVLFDLLDGLLTTEAVAEGASDVVAGRLEGEEETVEGTL